MWKPLIGGVLVIGAVVADARAQRFAHDPADIIDAGLVRDDGVVHTWFADGTLGVGTVLDLDEHALDLFTTPDGKAPSHIVGAGTCDATDLVVTWYDDGTVTTGTAEHPGAADAGATYVLPRGKSPSDIVGIAIAGASRDVFAWYTDRSFSTGTIHDLGARAARRSYTLPRGKAPEDVVAVAMSGEIVYAWYRDGTVSEGTAADLDAIWPPTPFTTDVPERGETAVALPGEDEPSRIEYEVRGGTAYFQGDIELGPVSRMLEAGPEHARRRSFGDVPPHRWWGGIIPYEISTTGFTPAERLTIERGARMLTERTNLTVVPRIAEPDYVVFRKFTHPVFGGTSAVGRQGGAQVIRINRNQPTGTVIHELLHAAGMMHEHARPDRDRYIEIDEEQVHPQMLPYLRRHTDRSQQLVPYDTLSIMHYGATAVSRRDEGCDPVPCIFDRRTGLPVGGRTRLSVRDVQRVNAMYPDTLGRKAHVFVVDEAQGRVTTWSWAKAHHEMRRSPYGFDVAALGAGDVVLTGDLLGNASEELIVVSCATGAVTILDYAFDASPAEHTRTSLGGPVDRNAIAVGDVRGNARDEIVAAVGRELHVWSWTAEGLTRLTDPVVTKKAASSNIAVGRVLDAAKAQILYWDDDAALWCASMRRGELTDRPLAGIEDPGRPELVTVADVTGDGRDEVVLFDGATGLVSVWARPERTLERVDLLDIGIGRADLVNIGDVLGGSKEELLTTNRETGEVTIWTWTGERLRPSAESIRTGADRRHVLAVGLPAYRP